MTETRANRVVGFLKEEFPIENFPPDMGIGITRESLTLLILHIAEKLERENPLPTNRLGVGITPPPIQQHCPCCIRYGNPVSPYAFAP